MRRGRYDESLRKAVVLWRGRLKDCQEENERSSARLEAQLAQERHEARQTTVRLKELERRLLSDDSQAKRLDSSREAAMTSALREARQRASEAERLQRQSLSQSPDSKTHWATLGEMQRQRNVLWKTLIASIAEAEQESASQLEGAIAAVVRTAGGVIARERIAMLVGIREAARGVWLDGHKRGQKAAKLKTKPETSEAAVGEQVCASTPCVAAMWRQCV